MLRNSGHAVHATDNDRIAPVQAIRRSGSIDNTTALPGEDETVNAVIEHIRSDRQELLVVVIVVSITGCTVNTGWIVFVSKQRSDQANIGGIPGHPTIVRDRRGHRVIAGNDISSSWINYMRAGLVDHVHIHCEAAIAAKDDGWITMSTSGARRNRNGLLRPRRTTVHGDPDAILTQRGLVNITITIVVNTIGQLEVTKNTRHIIRRNNDVL